MKLIRLLMLALIASSILMLAAPPAQAAVGTISISPTSGRGGTIVDLNGSGFTAGSNYEVRFGSFVVMTGVVSATGTITTSFEVPPTPRGTALVSVVTGAPDTSNTLTFIIAPQITVDTTSGRVGSLVNMTGAGFAATATIRVFFDSNVILTTNSNLNGSFTSVSVTVPATSYGPHSISAHDGTGFSPSTTFIVTPSVSVNPLPQVGGVETAVSGAGFAANSSITITIDGVGVAHDPIFTNAAGSFTVPKFFVPSLTRGMHTLMAADSAFHTASITFTTLQNMVVTPQSGSSGAAVKVTGSGFGTNRTISITYNGIAISTSPAVVTTDTSGTFTTNLVIPAGSSGDNVLEASDGVVSAKAVFTVIPSVSIEPNRGTVGSDIVVRGTSFSSGAPVSILYDDKAVSTGVVDAGGAFLATFKAPSSPAGNHVVTITSGTRTLTLNFTITASIKLNAASGFVGSDIVVAGTGFAANANIIVRYDELQAASMRSDAAGVFSVSFKAPPSKIGNHSITATDLTNNVSATFAISPTFTISPTSGNVGTVVTAVGTGFDAAKQVTVRYDNTQASQITTDSGGTFFATFTVPSSRGGNHVISATDGTTSQSAVFALDSMPPAVPTLLQPVLNTKAEPLPSLSWTPVTDPSGITYVLEIATDATFSNVILQKTGLTDSGYTLSEEEKLEPVSRQKPYTWRVKTIDGASNESPWSSPETFYVGFVMPTWGLYAIFGATVILAALAGFFFGRRIAVQGPGEPTE